MCKEGKLQLFEEQSVRTHWNVEQEERERGGKRGQVKERGVR